MRARSVRRLLLGVLLVGLLGCGGERRGSVSGKVTLEGQPLNAAGVVISFLGKDGRPVTAEVGRDGNYTASGVLVGEAIVLVSWNPPPGQDPAHTSKPKDVDPTNYRPPAEGAAPAKSPVPERYGDPSRSGLKTVVDKGQNIYNVDLKRQ